MDLIRRKLNRSGSLCFGSNSDIGADLQSGGFQCNQYVGWDYEAFIYGGVIAFVLNIPLCQIEDYILAGWKGRSADKAKRPVGIILSILFVIVTDYDCHCNSCSTGGKDCYGAGK